MRLRAPGISLILTSALCFGCGPKHVSAPAPVDQGSFLVHFVAKPGETVRSLSKWYTGSEKPAKEIAQLSNVRESTPLKVGQRVLIPTAYVKKTTPPPKPKSRPNSQQVATKDEPAENNTMSGNEPSPGPEPLTPGRDPLDPNAWTAPTEQRGIDSNQEDKAVDVTSEKPDSSIGVAAEPDVPASKPVESFEELLLKEQLEVERLRREMQAAPSAGAAVE